MPAVVLTQPNGPSSFSLAIRGVTQNDFADHQESPAAIYVDDVYVSQMAGLAFSLFDIDRVEVLRGPQGTLFGRNATGGLANFVTRRPDDTAGGYVDVTFGERNLTRVEGALNAPLTDSIDARLSYLSNHYDPLFRNIAGGAADAENGNDWALRGQLLFKLPNEGKLLLNLRASREDVHAGSWEESATKGVGNGVDLFVGANENIYGCAGCNATGLTNSGPFVNARQHQRICAAAHQRPHCQILAGPRLQHPHGDRRLFPSQQGVPGRLRRLAVHPLPVLQRQPGGAGVPRGAAQRRRQHLQLDRGPVCAAHRWQVLRGLAGPRLLHGSAVQRRGQSECGLRAGRLAVRRCRHALDHGRRARAGRRHPGDRIAVLTADQVLRGFRPGGVAPERPDRLHGRRARHA